MTDAESQLTDWITYLKKFKTCCAKVNSDANQLSLLAFANAKIATLLPTDNDKGDFAVRGAKATQLPITQAVVAASTTFVSLLQTTWDFINIYVVSYIQLLAPPPFPAMNSRDFILQKTAAVFPADPADPAWVNIDTGLARILGPDCYSAAQRKKVAAIVADPTKQINDLVNQIAVLG